MLLPSLMNGNFFDDWMPDFPSGKDFFRGTGTNGMMKTDVKETEKTFELEMDLPGFKKEDVTAKLDSGYLTISASRNEENDEKDEDGKYIRRERYTGDNGGKGRHASDTAQCRFCSKQLSAMPLISS